MSTKTMVKNCKEFKFKPQASGMSAVLAKEQSCFGTMEMIP
jgi:hypothetical protein